MDRTEKRVKEVEEQKRGTRLEAQIKRKSQDLGVRMTTKGRVYKETLSKDGLATNRETYLQ